MTYDEYLKHWKALAEMRVDELERKIPLLVGLPCLRLTLMTLQENKYYIKMIDSYFTQKKRKRKYKFH